jgi:hypothetical protein
MIDAAFEIPLEENLEFLNIRPGDLSLVSHVHPVVAVVENVETPGRGFSPALGGSRRLFNLTYLAQCAIVAGYAAVRYTSPRPALLPPCVRSATARRSPGRRSAWPGGEPLIFDATAHPLPSSVSRRHSVHETLKTDVKYEAVNLLKTKSLKFEFSPGEAVNLLQTGLLTRIERGTKSWGQGAWFTRAE